ncbi:hypothetical protein LZ318_28105 [Saccharopolyspora indica]|uniref:hypothetical protein n=1 Tax=Saccharopolyspora indica TaxID=1229659 RepID=UPI0022EB78BF|nr:hypothetical protein [Saccharopolyspora indica]MDA3645727.1 hypothetical protein [Saccharopolyspora indica]
MSDNSTGDRIRVAVILDDAIAIVIGRDGDRHIDLDVVPLDEDFEFPARPRASS